MRGFGTVVTGTLISGTLDADREVELYPMGRRLRVRGIQVYGQPARRAHAGERTAVNLADIEPAEIRRGMVLSEPGLFRAGHPPRLPLRSASVGEAAEERRARPLSHRHRGDRSGGALARRRTALKPGESAWARITLAEPALVLPGRSLHRPHVFPVSTIGGGIVADITAHRYRKGEERAPRA